MLPSLETVEADAMQLPAAERALLVERLIASLDADPVVEAAWAAEVEPRQRDIDSGAVTWLDGSTVLAELPARVCMISR